MFRNRKSYTRPSFVDVVEYDTVEDLQDDGTIIVRSVPKVSKLPPFSDYKLEELLRAGVPLQEVNPTVINNLPTDTVSATETAEKLIKKALRSQKIVNNSPAPTADPIPSSDPIQSTEPTDVSNK